MYDADSYTVGWICAISTEYIAAQLFLDETFARPEDLDPSDSNAYTVGKIGKHKVVIAVLTKGEYGISPAVSVATNMVRSFPNIRISLMVGIAGGAPNPDDDITCKPGPGDDIRLGDIVVSCPYNGDGGVFQYDFGWTMQGQKFQDTMHLNQPPDVFMTAVSQLESKYKLAVDGHQLEKAIVDALKEKPRLQNDFNRPDPSSDRLYESNVTHPANNYRGCAATCGDDPSKLVSRRTRTEHDDNPRVHYGLIASGSQLMMDALIRDMLATEKKVLCFEMEAAGLVNRLPCLVIRGICDYSDSHKNKDWQGYAAMAAAAYAKDLLLEIPPKKVENETRIGELLSSGQSS